MDFFNWSRRPTPVTNSTPSKVERLAVVASLVIGWDKPEATLAKARIRINQYTEAL